MPVVSSHEKWKYTDPCLKVVWRIISKLYSSDTKLIIVLFFCIFTFVLLFLTFSHPTRSKILVSTMVCRAPGDPNPVQLWHLIFWCLPSSRGFLYTDPCALLYPLPVLSCPSNSTCWLFHTGPFSEIFLTTCLKNALSLHPQEISSRSTSFYFF